MYNINKNHAIITPNKTTHPPPPSVTSTWAWRSLVYHVIDRYTHLETPVPQSRLGNSLVSLSFVHEINQVLIYFPQIVVFQVIVYQRCLIILHLLVFNPVHCYGGHYIIGLLYQLLFSKPVEYISCMCFHSIKSSNYSLKD